MEKTHKRLQGRTIYPGRAQGEALVTRMGISFFGGVDPDTGLIVEKGHELEGQAISGRILVFPTGKGSTVGSYTLYRLKQNGRLLLRLSTRSAKPLPPWAASSPKYPASTTSRWKKSPPGTS